MNNFWKTVCFTFSIFFIGLFAYSAIGTSGDVEYIKKHAPAIIAERNLEIVRYEGWQYGSWDSHGGKVWYHVKDVNLDNIYYRVWITEWAGELHFNYGSPERLLRVDIDSSNLKPILN